MFTLGLSFDYHDSAAVLMKDGIVIAAAQEERFTRKKHDASFPKNSIDFCLKQAAIRTIDLTRVVHYEDPFDKLARILLSSRGKDKNSHSYRQSTIKSWFSRDKLGVCDRIAKNLQIPKERISTMNHHQAHAASAFFCSPFDEATVITIDGAGEFETASVSIGRGNELIRMQSIQLPNSLGLLYSALTAYLGFEVNEGEYKVMGMAGFGTPVYYDKLRSLVKLENNGSFSIEQKRFNFLTPQESVFNHHLTDLLGPARPPESVFSIDKNHDAYIESKRFADIAASIQLLTEDIIIHVVSNAVSQTGIKNVCMAGGCALNSLANTRVIKECGVNLFVQPSAGDAGGALGAALYGTHVLGGKPRTTAMTSAYLGSYFENIDIEKAINSSGLKPHKVFSDDNEIANMTAQLLSTGAVVGWFQGAAEWGPRALGARSILADPTRPNVKAIVNEKIKFRELFRPFAPSVLSERADEFFDIAGMRTPYGTENFMLQVCPVREEMRELLPAITHVDGTARVQTVRKEANPLYYNLINEIGKINGVPMVLNTSFNLRGEPIVDSPEDAIRTFSWSDMDYLVMGNYLLKKEWCI